MISMKHRLFKLALFLILGALVNVTVAWGCAVWLTIDVNQFPDKVEFRDEISGPGSSLWRVQQIKRSGAMRILTLWVAESDLEILANGNSGSLHLPAWCLSKDRLNSEATTIAIMDARGWPMLSLSSAVKSDAPELLENMSSEAEVLWGLRLSQDSAQISALLYANILLPTRIIWPGFVIDTIMYAAIVWFVVFVPFATRRLIRRKRGLCIKCGYDLRHVEHEKCPECGAAIRRHR